MTQAFDHTAKDHFLVTSYPQFIHGVLGPVMTKFGSTHKTELCVVPADGPL
jgi:hypothetical protein